MSAPIDQDKQFIAYVRNHSTYTLNAADAGVNANSDWNSLYGGSGRLATESFTGGDEGLTKTDIENAKNVIYALNAWLDEGGTNRRSYLMKVCFQAAV